MYPYSPCYGNIDYGLYREMQQPYDMTPYNVPYPSGGAFPAIPSATPSPTPVATAEESYVENILRMNRGKIATIYMTFENNSLWNAKVFRGRVETAGRDHIIISDPETGKRYILLMVNLDYITFDEPIAYIPPAYPGREEDSFD
jgi:spore germination protein Q